MELASSLDRTDSLLVQGAYLYWTTRGRIPGLQTELFTVFRRKLDRSSPPELLAPETRIGREVSTRIAVDERALYSLQETFAPNDQGALAWTGTELRACPGMVCGSTQRVLLRGGTGGDPLYGLSADADGVFVYNGDSILRVRPYTGG